MRCPECQQAWSECPGHRDTVTVISPGFETIVAERIRRGELPPTEGVSKS